MVSKISKKTSTRSSKDRRRKKSPAKIASSALSSINRTLFTCRRRLAKIFSELVSINTPIRYKGYKTLKKQGDKTPKREEKVTGTSLPNGVCKGLFFDQNSKLPPLLSPTKRTVFLDLDETLVHSSPDPPPEVYDFIVRPKIDGIYMTFYVLKRPGVDLFLEELAEKYEMVVFTAGLKEYASLVLDKLDEKGLITHRLYRDSCKQVEGKFVKDLSEMGRDLKRMVIIDDNPNCYVFQPDNAVPVRPFIDNLRDGELGKLGRFLGVCDGYEDMRDAVKDYLSE